MRAGIVEKPKVVSWSFVMIMMLRENFDCMPVKELSKMLGVSTGALGDKMQELQLHPPRTVQAPVKKVKKKKWTDEECEAEIRQRKRQEENRQRLKVDKQVEENRRKRNAKVFVVRNVDYSQFGTVRIDSKTHVVLKPGQDPEEVRKKYTRTFSKNGLSKIE